ncbi:ester cyclase [Haloarcula nitratireducens]|uniref:Ester cyclase n=1 Tax=Haloarcula nitratireducens TaxID=2487749 RepID=A0AAW4PJ16_9EURY|nr:ester cyclase [Halomicroarcula nitratireducens]MBX0297938.1 ester cyclase [Halomicroarcula nitratireducens]
MESTIATLEQANKKHTRRFNEEVWGHRNFAAIDQFVAREFIGYNPARPESICGPDGVRDLANLLYVAFPDCEVALEQVIADGNWVAQRVSISATYKGEFMGVEPTESPVELTGMNHALRGRQVGRRIRDLGHVGPVHPTGDYRTT